VIPRTAGTGAGLDGLTGDFKNGVHG